MKGNVIVGQSGGPTAVINSSLAGVFKTAMERGFTKVYGMRNGIQGFLEERLVDLDTVLGSNELVKLLRKTPAAFLGSCRFKLPDFDVKWLDSRWVDLQQVFDDRLGLHNNLALKHALGAMDHQFEGTQHTALADAINTSAILVLMQDDEKFRKTMQPVLDILQPKDDLASSIGDLCPDLLKLKNDLEE